jgi:hypothetical protein
MNRIDRMFSSILSILSKNVASAKGVSMPYLTKYHLGEQCASALLGPIADTLRELERRTGHYAERLSTSVEDQEAILAAHRALAAARAEIERIRATTDLPRGSDV